MSGPSPWLQYMIQTKYWDLERNGVRMAGVVVFLKHWTM